MTADRKNTLRFDCPYCKQPIEAPPYMVGHLIDCPSCKKTIEFPFWNPTPKVEKSPLPYCVPPPKRPSRESLNPRIDLSKIPQRIKDVLWEGETPVYSSRPAHSALVLSMVAFGIVWGIIGLSFFIVGILVTLPLALVITYFSWKNRYYIITKERTVVSQGIFNVGIKIIFNRHIQLISINTGIIDRWIGLNTIEVSTAAQGGAGGIMASFPGLAKGATQLKSVNVKDVIRCYDQLREL